MKIGILTHYNVNNQGAQLQMYALWNYLCSLGHETVILTYNKNFDFIPEEGKKNNVSLKSIPYFLKNYLLKKGMGLTVYNAKKYYTLARMRKRNYRFQSYHSDDLDAVIIGSDEVYSIDVGINSMMYGHALCCENTISYAPSFGRTTSKILKKEGCYELVKSGMEKMKFLSARDLHTKEMIKELAGKDVPIVCDPVFLIDFKKQIASKKKLHQPYLLVYSYDAHMNEKEEYEAIQEFAQKRGLLTVSAGTYHKWCDRNIVCDPLEWVEYFKNAEYVITDTFHGYVNALKAQKETALFVRNQINAFKLKSLMEQTKTEEREFFEFSLNALENVFSKKMDYEKIERLLENMTRSGEDFISEVLRAHE